MFKTCLQYVDWLLNKNLTCLQKFIFANYLLKLSSICIQLINLIYTTKIMFFNLFFITFNHYEQ